MNANVCTVAYFCQKLISVYIAVMFLYLLTLWLPGLRGRWTDYAARIVEPLLGSIRRVVPTLSGIDFSFVIAILLLQLISRALMPRYCFFV